MVVFHIVIAIDIIRNISWLTSRWFRDYPPQRVLKRFVPVFRAVREVTLIKDGVGSGEHCIGGAHKQKVALIASGNTDICHELRLRGHFICSSHGLEVDKGSTAKHTEVVNFGQLPLKHFMGGAPVQASYWSTVVYVGCMSEHIFPPGVRDAGLMPHRLSFIHESAP